MSKAQAWKILHRGGAIGRPCLTVSPLPPCGNVYAPGAALAGNDGDVYQSAPRDPDGSGPRRKLLVIGIELDGLGNVTAVTGSNALRYPLGVL